MKYVLTIPRVTNKLYHALTAELVRHDPEPRFSSRAETNESTETRSYVVTKHLVSYRIEEEDLAVIKLKYGHMLKDASITNTCSPFI